MSIVPADECDCPIFNPACFNIVVPSTGGTTVQSGLIGSMLVATGTVTFPTPYTAQPQVLLTLNLNGGLVHIPIAVSTFTVVGTLYTGFTWASATTSALSTISWISVQ
jgi:hypothetical protein